MMLSHEIAWFLATKAYLTLQILLAKMVACMLGIFITAGHPNIEKSIKALQILDEAQVDLIEFGVPFSDPLADGPAIQKSSHEALEAGVNLDKIFEIIKEAKAKQGIELKDFNQNGFEQKGLKNIILFSYYNPLLAYGFEKLIKQCKEHGVRGVLIPDLPMDEAHELTEEFKQNNLDIVLLAAPTTTETRAKQICDLSSPFVYLVSRTGTTGSAENFDQKDNLKTLIKDLKKFTDNPIGVGFGIDEKKKVDQVLELGADMAIIGSKAVKVLESDNDNLDDFSKFIKSLK